MPPVTGEPQLGGEEVADVAIHEKGRPPDEIYEGDKMDTSSERFPSALTSKSTEISAEDTEQLKPSASRKGKRKLESHETHPHIPDGSHSEDEESADALGPSRSDSTDPRIDRHHRDNFPRKPSLDSSFDSLARILDLGLGIPWLWREKKYPIWQPGGNSKYPIWQPGKSEHTIQQQRAQQRAQLVHGAWASIENVRKISSSLLVNKPQCEHIADHFNVTGDVLEKLRLGKDFVSSQALGGGNGIQINLTFEETRFANIAESFDKHLYFTNIGESFDQITKIRDWLTKFHQCIRPLPAMDGSSDQSLSKKLMSYEVSLPEIIEARSDYWMEHRLDEFLWLLFEVLKHGEDLVLFHSGLQRANNGVVERTGTSGEKFVEIHGLLYGLLDCYACLEHCEGTEFASGYFSGSDVCRAESIVYYWNSNLGQKADSLFISNNFLSIEMATGIADMLRGLNCALKKLSIVSSPGAKVDQEELRKCRLMIIAALSGNVGLTDLTVRASNVEEVHELCKSLRDNRVLENLDISTDGPLADNDALNLSAMVTGNHSLRRFTLEFDDVSLTGAVYLGGILAAISLDRICLRSRRLRGFIKYLVRSSMPYIDGKLNVILSVKDCHSFFEMRLYVCTRRELPTDGTRKIAESDTEMLHVIKAENCLSISFVDLDPDAVCEVLDSLKKNETLRVLKLESWPRDGRKLGDNREVAACLEAVLAENSSLRELKVQFYAWDKCFVQHLLRPLMAEKDGEPHVNISLRQLQINYFLDKGMISSAEPPPNECGEVAESIARMLRTNKTLTHFSVSNPCWRTSDVCEIVDSLKLNKALQILGLECKVFDDPQVKVAFIDLLVNYNFTLSTMSTTTGTLWKSSIENFMKNQLILDTKMAPRELWSHACTTLDSPIVEAAHDLNQAVKTLQLEEKGEELIEEECGSSKRAFDKHKSEVEAKDERPQVFLSYSNEMRDFASLLCKELKSSNYNVVDQDSINPAAVLDQCQLAIIILSDMYVKSKPLMSELNTIVKSKKTNNPTLKVYPLFYKLTLHDLQNPYVPVSTIDGEGSSLDIALEREALNFLCEGKNEVSRKANDLVENWHQGGVDVGRFCEEFSGLQRSSWPSNGLEVEKNAIFEEGYLHAILEEISHYMPVVKDSNNGYTSRHQGMLEMESKLSIRQMKSLLESLPMKDFSTLRNFNMAQYLQEKYIQNPTFEEMCPSNLYPLPKNDYSKGRIAAALFPTTFLYHFKVHIFQYPRGGFFRPMWKAAADWVVKMMKSEVQTSTFFDFVDYGAPFDPQRMIAICQNFSTKTSNDSTQLVIMQDELTKAYYYQCVEASDLEKPPIDESIGVMGVQVTSEKTPINETIGVIGVQVTSEGIYVDNIHVDGSSYSGVLEDFSYKYDVNENKQCAAKAFGDLEGARFLPKNRGVKCSPLLIIALASAIKRKGLTLTWRKGKGHIEFYPKIGEEVKVEVEATACQIQYTSKINQLGLEIEWGTPTNSCAAHNQTFQMGTNEIANPQVIGANVDPGVGTPGDGTANVQVNVNGTVGTSGSRDDSTANVVPAVNTSNDATDLAALAQNATTRSFGVQAAGFGISGSLQTRDSVTEGARKRALQGVVAKQVNAEGGFHKISTLDTDYPDLERLLLTCQLRQVHDHNYLVVHNDEPMAHHISIYEAIERNEGVPKFGLKWISDIPIYEEEQINKIFETGLKGRELIVERKSSDFVEIKYPSKVLRKIVPGYLENLSKIKRRVPKAIDASMKSIQVRNLVDKYKSRNEWEHIIGHQAKYGASNKYWWEGTYMEAMVYLKTWYKSGILLTTETKVEVEAIGLVGYCSVREGPKEYKHLWSPVGARAKYSRLGSLLDNKAMWGGLDIV